MSAGRREMLMKAIVGLKMTVENVEGSFKLNQHKADVDHAAIATELLRQGDAGAQAIGERMIALRPQLDYKSLAPASGPVDGRNMP
jgi:transcriptional regulator